MTKSPEGAVAVAVAVKGVVVLRRFGLGGGIDMSTGTSTA